MPHIFNIGGKYLLEEPGNFVLVKNAYHDRLWLSL